MPELMKLLGPLKAMMPVASMLPTPPQEIPHLVSGAEVLKSREVEDIVKSRVEVVFKEMLLQWSKMFFCREPRLLRTVTTLAMQPQPNTRTLRHDRRNNFRSRTVPNSRTLAQVVVKIA